MRRGGERGGVEACIHAFDWVDGWVGGRPTTRKAEGKRKTNTDEKSDSPWRLRRMTARGRAERTSRLVDIFFLSFFLLGGVAVVEVKCVEEPGDEKRRRRGRVSGAETKVRRADAGGNASALGVDRQQKREGEKKGGRRTR